MRANAAAVSKTTTSLAMATIINLDRSNERIECMFNPTEYTVAKRNRWTEGNNSGSDTLQMEFTSGEPETLKMQLFFDTFAQKQDVRTVYTKKIWDLMMVDSRLVDRKSQKGRPPVVRFQWGEDSSWSFDAVITSITQKFTLFLPNGTPVRATLDVSFQQVRDPRLLPRQNPTSGGMGAERVWTVSAGDTLAWIAYKSYGEPGDWRQIADANRLTNVRRLVPGQVLVIPNV